ncbi:MAG: ABC transporter permease, partial [bacterium]
MSQLYSNVLSEVKKFWSNFKKNKAAVIYLYFTIALFIIAILAPVLAPAHMIALDPRNILQRPQTSHPLGTDNLGRDLLGVIIHGSRITLL